MNEGLGRRAARAGSATLVGQAFKVLILLSNLVVLGRLLEPRDFGIVALGLAIVGVSDLLRDLGLSTAAIRASQLDHRDASNLFWVNTGLGISLAALSSLLARPIAMGFGTPELELVIYGLSAVFVLNGVQTQFQVQLARAYRFGQLAASDVFAQSVGLATGIALAAAGGGFWALVGLQVSAASALLGTRAYLSHWRPSYYDRTRPMRHFLRFGASLTAGQILGFMANSAPSVALGAATRPADVGYFSRSFQIISIPINQGLGPLTNVVVASLSRIQREKFGEWILTVTTLVSTAGTATFVLVFFTAPAAVPALMGPAWQPAVITVQILALGAIFQTLTFPYYWLFISLDKPRDLLLYNFASKGLTVCTTLGGIPWGLTGVTVGYAVGLAISLPICLAWFKREAAVPSSPMRGLAMRLTIVAALSVAVLEASGSSIGPGLQSSLPLTTAASVLTFSSVWLLVCGRRDARMLRRAISQLRPVGN